MERTVASRLSRIVRCKKCAKGRALEPLPQETVIDTAIRRLPGCLVCVAWVAALPAAGAQERGQAMEPAPIETVRLEPMKAHVVSFRSSLYRDRQPLALCVTEVSPNPKPLLIDLIPGTLGRPESAARDCEETCRIAQAA